MSKLAVVILAAGRGTRMRSVHPKVLHAIAGRPMLAHVLSTAAELSPIKTIIVYGHGGEAVRSAIGDAPDRYWVEQADQKGTGHAVQQAADLLGDSDRVLVLYGDVPLLPASTLRSLLIDSAYTDLGILTMHPADPTGYGRIVRDASGAVAAIVEQKDANAAQSRIAECNSGILCASTALLLRWLERLDTNNAQGELYLTDVVAEAVAEGVEVATHLAGDEEDVAGINDREQLARLERVLQRRQADALMRAGVSLADPDRIDIRGALSVGEDSSIDINSIFEGEVSIGRHCRIGPNVLISDSRIGDGCEILANSVIEQAEVGPACRVGPFARLRPGTQLGGNNHVGNFVEIKKSQIGDGSKINHLSYVGDSEVGKRVNIGAGTITCNYDGANKHKTTIGDDAFIGSDTQLVAPVSVGARSTIGAGSTITHDAPDGELTLSRSKQQTVTGWQRPRKKG